MTSVRRVVAEFWQAAGLVPNGLAMALPVVVGVSGGVDSLVLWHILAAGGVAPASGLVVATLDHGLRPEAAGDVAFVRSLALAAGMSFRTAQVDVPALAREHGQSLEEAAREARYAFLARVARSAGAQHVAVAHHADDQAETVLLHLLRGSGLTGLQGMLPEAPLPGAPDLTLLRPLLGVSRREIEAYAAAHGLEPRVDASNADVGALRNRLRHALLPALEAYNPQIRDALVRMANVLAADEQVLADLADQALRQHTLDQGPGLVSLDREGWRKLPLGLRRRVLRQAALSAAGSGRDLNFTALERARRLAESGETGKQAPLPHGLRLEIGYGRISLIAAGGTPEPDLPQMPGKESLHLALPGSLTLANGWRLQAKGVPDSAVAGIHENVDPWMGWVSLPDEVMALHVRGRLPGERFQPLGMDGQSKSVKDVMIDRKVPAALRQRWPIAASDEHLVWLVGHLLDERTAVRAGQGRIWQLTCERVEERSSAA